ncbi:hypothetical protein HPB47_010574 [Ixodes persulcatus]|uniref:Uncharacterized protein n=1 Tax=Ixodes persulcatus TaxID=34615 RepID=A0AC60NYN8_IXOPE|nr:hypothetical protein HPB47_010574 [Ixodes persulcatus]
MQRLSVYVDSKLLRRRGREKLLHSVKNAKRTRSESSGSGGKASTPTASSNTYDQNQYHQHHPSFAPINIIHHVEMRSFFSLAVEEVLNLEPKLAGTDDQDAEDFYIKYKKLERQLEFLAVQEEYIKDEQRNLKKEYLHAQEEVKRIQSVPLVIGQFLEAVDPNTGIVGSTTARAWPLHKHSNALVDVLPPEADSSISMLRADEKPDIKYADIGGLDIQKQEIREAVELPLTHFELYKQIGIDPPRGVLMYGTSRLRQDHAGQGRRTPHHRWVGPG